MSDDDEISYVKKSNTIHYGSLEESERAKQAALEEIDSDEDDFTAAEPEAKVPKLSTAPGSGAAPQPSSSTGGSSSTTQNEYFDLEQEV